ncbi:hypothetical protein INR49_005221 [Caranx melampygus]|nr:hypothetical protein INR49_005221 [Caranx melampygus]
MARPHPNTIHSVDGNTRTTDKTERAHLRGPREPGGNLLNWTRDSQNRLMFTERIEKYALFKNPQECFGGSSVSVPEMEGLWLKEDGKKSWKKRYFLLRASGIYYVPKGRPRCLQRPGCFLQLDHVNVYHGQDYKSKYKAPTDYCMVLKRLPVV